MPTYLYLCPKGHREEVWRSIHTINLQTYDCDVCGVEASLVFSSPAIAADALPNKKHGVRAIDATERGWDKDMPAYKRLREQGYQPRHVDGAAMAEAEANHPLEIAMGRPLGKEKDVRRAQEITSELLQRDVTKEGEAIGKTKRGNAA